MSLQKKLNEYWSFLEKKYPAPKTIGVIKKIEFDELKKAIDGKNEKFLKKLIRGMYVKKEAYILKNSAPKKFKETIIDLANHYKKTRKPSFYKTLDGVPNFHRIIDKNITKKYSVYAIKHSFFFFIWNIKIK